MQGPCLHNIIENTLETSGDCIYIESSNGDYSYSMVYQLADSIKKGLQSLGATENDRIVIYSLKSESFIACMIASSMLQCTYIPVSSLNPPFRVENIIQQTDPKFVFMDTNCSEAYNNQYSGLSKQGKVGTLLMYVNTTYKGERSNIESPAYILFTSGSTGDPKGVVVSHESAITFIKWAESRIGINKKDKVTSISPFNFDLSVFDIYVSMISGATLLLYTETEVKNAILMGKQISDQKASVVYATPTFFSTIINYGRMNKYNYSSLKKVLFAGEVINVQKFNELYEILGNKEYFNLYGPTETNVCTYYPFEGPWISANEIPIGKPCDYSDILIIDSSKKVVKEVGKEGELCISGKSLFDGYWGQDNEINMGCYFTQGGLTYYKTGDIVFRDVQGNLCFKGRNDAMIKRNGFRIEPAEIERSVNEIDFCNNSKVIFSKQKQELICFVEVGGQTVKDVELLRAHLSKRLPMYMMPDSFIFLESIPSTVSGKIDIQELSKYL